MKTRPHFPLLAKVLAWLFLHLLILALAFVAFVGWQLGLGLDSLLSGSAGDRLRDFGDATREKILYLKRPDWDAQIGPIARDKNVRAMMFDPDPDAEPPFKIPENVIERCRNSIPPEAERAPRRRPPPIHQDGPPEDMDSPPPDDFEPGPDSPPRRSPRAVDGLRREASLPPTRPVFLMRGSDGDGYWAGVQIVLPGPPGQPRHPHLLLIRADTLDGSGMFFDFKPWLWGGLAVLALSLAFWTPFVWAITRYVRRLTAVADRIAAGDFKVSVPHRGNDELGSLGNAIERMAGRLDHLVAGQKRFLGDAAHELCAPLARLRTGLGILEMKLADSDLPNLVQIESEAAELASLVEEILAFSRAGNRTPRLQMIPLEPLVHEVVGREGGGLVPSIDIPEGLAVAADGNLLARAVGNIVRNSRVHAGAGARISIRAIASPGFVDIVVTDDGPGVPADELSRLFEPFYRPDLSRSRDTGGTGLGLAIVQTAVEACGGTASASIPEKGGFSVSLRLRSSLPESL